MNVRQKQPGPGASLAEHEAYDPWEALDVEWEMGGALEAEEGGCLRVSPWEIEGDPETEARRLEELRKQEEASARTARALAKSRRCALCSAVSAGLRSAVPLGESVRQQDGPATAAASLNECQEFLIWLYYPCPPQLQQVCLWSSAGSFLQMWDAC